MQTINVSIRKLDELTNEAIRLRARRHTPPLSKEEMLRRTIIREFAVEREELAALHAQR